ncbi:MAG: hypothetical protein HC915_17180 [Anaerolineae bacterium]|nr:hypothetical protein [Anaerolineae bacterium]
MGGVMGAVGGATLGMQAGANVFSSNLGQTRPEIGKQRIAARVPSDMAFPLWVKRLREDKSAEQRAKAARELQELNNPSVLPDLAEAYFAEQHEPARQVIEGVIRMMYLNLRYWELDRTGEIDAEVRRRLEARGKAIAPQLRSTTTAAAVDAKRSTQESSAEELAKILRDAEINRAKRQQKRR